MLLASVAHFKCVQHASILQQQAITSNRAAYTIAMQQPTLLLLLLCVQLMDTLKLPKGPALGQATAAVMDWQLAHPQGSKEECIEHMKAVHAELQP